MTTVSVTRAKGIKAFNLSFLILLNKKTSELSQNRQRNIPSMKKITTEEKEKTIPATILYPCIQETIEIKIGSNK